MGLLTLHLGGGATAAELPAMVIAALPRGYHVITAISGPVVGRSRAVFVVALEPDGAAAESGESARNRPLLILRPGPGDSYLVAGRNDHVVMRRDQGLQCDPFERGLAASGRFFTVQNGVACGQHWNDFITFRYEERRRTYVFHKEVSEAWRLNDDPNGEALVLDGRSITKADPKRPIDFERYRPDW